MQSFGGTWTLLKLDIIGKYLAFYTNALKNQKFKLCYIDAFAGSGDIDVRGFGNIPGSALRAIDYPFDKYIFIENDNNYARKLSEAIKNKRFDKDISIIPGDCNELLETIYSVSWYKNRWRGVIFLDPYAMDLKWASLEAIAKTKAFDVWYLFPLSALNRVLQKRGNIPKKNKSKINDLLGTTEWEKEIYYESPQLALFGEQEIERISIDGIKKFVIQRLKMVFPAVSEKSLVLRNPLNRSPLFLLCFAISNDSKTAIKLSLKAADHILTHTELL
ncbi:MAG: three-Cys-motif partner protein TcmP [Firmicutes bacterium]|nr:three-Cys-motif partner protein TcmP [Bacillota bacterium]